MFFVLRNKKLKSFSVNKFKYFNLIILIRVVHKLITLLICEFFKIYAVNKKWKILLFSTKLLIVFNISKNIKKILFYCFITNF